MYLRDGKLPFDGMHEECGVFGVYSTETRDVAHTAYYGLYALQHRGQESAGIAVAYADKIQYYKGMGLVPEVFANGRLETLPEGDIAVGHVRYSTTGASLPVNAQPIVFTGKCGKMALAHNGNLTNTRQLREELIRDNAVFQTSIDSEVMALLINKYSDGDIVQGVIKACERFRGSFALVVMAADKLIAVRDSFGIRPLVLGKSLDDTLIASETCAIDAVGGTVVRDVIRAKSSSSTRTANIPISCRRKRGRLPASSSTSISRGRTALSTAAACTRRGKRRAGFSRKIIPSTRISSAACPIRRSLRRAAIRRYRAFPMRRRSPRTAMSAERSFSPTKACAKIRLA